MRKAFVLFTLALAGTQAVQVASEKTSKVELAQKVHKMEGVLAAQLDEMKNLQRELV